MRPLSYIFYNYFYKHLLKLYLKTDSRVTFDGFRLKVFKDVFHPKLFFSTSFFYSYLSGQELNHKRFLEIGSGCGILGMLALKKGASVTAVDIDLNAVENTRLNFRTNFPSLEKVSVLQSDLFTALPTQHFDMVVINPPYYFKKVEVAAHYAWYCGENGEYFKNLFSQLRAYMAPSARVYMVLEENCEIARISEMAQEKGFRMELVQEKRIRWEKNFIFCLT